MYIHKYADAVCLHDQPMICTVRAWHAKIAQQTVRICNYIDDFSQEKHPRPKTNHNR